MDIKELFGYKGKNVVITGSASGMSYDATEMLIELGANVYAVDLNEITLPVKKLLKQIWQRKNRLMTLLQNCRRKLTAFFCAMELQHIREMKCWFKRLIF